VQRKNDAAGADLNAIRYRRAAALVTEGFWVQATKSVKMTFRRPNCGEDVIMGILRLLKKQRMLGVELLHHLAKIEEAESMAWLTFRDSFCFSD